MALLKLNAPLYGSLREPWLGLARSLCRAYFATMKPETQQIIGIGLLSVHTLVITAFFAYLTFKRTMSRHQRVISMIILVSIIVHWYLLGGMCCFTPIESHLLNTAEISAAARIGRLLGLPVNISEALMFSTVVTCIVIVIFKPIPPPGF